jgi:hypothetical protein
MGGEGALSLRGYRELFESQGFKIGHWEIQRKIIILKDLDALKEWIALEMAPRLGVQGDPKFVETYFDSMQKMGWMELEEGRIGFPEEKLKVLLYKM